MDSLCPTHAPGLHTACTHHLPDDSLPSINHCLASVSFPSQCTTVSHHAATTGQILANQPDANRYINAISYMPTIGACASVIHRRSNRESVSEGVSGHACAYLRACKHTCTNARMNYLYQYDPTQSVINKKHGCPFFFCVP